MLELAIPTPPKWQEDALCQEVGYALFEDGRRPDEARAVCNRCPVLDQCGTWILDLEEHEATVMPDIYAGMTAGQRRDIRTARRAAA